MAHYRLRISNAIGSEAFEVRVDLDGEPYEFAEGHRARLFKTLLAAVDGAVELIAKRENYGEEEFAEDFKRHGHVLELEGDPFPLRVARVHLVRLRGFDVQSDEPRPPSAADLTDVLDRAIREWEGLVAPEPDEAAWARAQRDPIVSATATELRPRLALVPRTRGREALGPLLEVLAGRSLVDSWASELLCVVRLSAGAEHEDELLPIDPATRDALAHQLEAADARRLSAADDHRRRALIDSLRGSTPTGEPRALLGHPIASAALWEVKLAESGLWFDGSEVLALFPAESTELDRRHRCANLAAPPVHSLHVELVNGEQLRIVRGDAVLAEVRSSTVEALALAYAAIDGRAGRSRPRTNVVLAAIGAQAGRADWYATKGRRVEALLEPGRNGAIKAEEIRSYVNHVFGRDALIEPLRAYLADHGAPPRVAAASAAQVLREAARRYEGRAGQTRQVKDQGDRGTKVIALREAIRARCGTALTRLEGELGRIRERAVNGTGARERRAAMAGVVVKSLDVRDLTEGRGEAAVVVDRLLGARLRNLAVKALHEVKHDVTRSLEVLATSIQDRRGPASSSPWAPLGTWADPPLPAIARHLGRGEWSSDRQVAELLAVAKRRFTEDLERWLEGAIGQLCEAAASAAQAHARLAEAELLVDLPIAVTTTRGETGAFERFTECARRLESLADELRRAAE